MKKYEAFREKAVKPIEGENAKLYITENVKTQDGKTKKKRVFF